MCSIRYSSAVMLRISPLLPLLFCCFGWPAIGNSQQPSQSLRKADAEYREGVAALNRKDLKTAEAKFAEVVRLAPAAEQGYSALGTVLLYEGQTAAGIHALEKALSIKPGDESAQLNLSLAYEQTRAFAKALPLFVKQEKEARASNHPLSLPVLAAYARTLAATGDRTGAIARMKEAVARAPHNAQLHDDLGSLLAQAQQWGDAEAEYKTAIGIDDTFALAHLHLGYVYKAEQKPEAYAEWMRAHEVAPNDPRIALEAGKALASAGRDDEAAKLLQQALDAAPGSTDAAFQLAVVLQRLNRVPDAIELLRTVVAAEPKNADALTNLGMALSQQHKAEDAIQYLQRAVTLKPRDAVTHQDLAAAYIQINQIDDAIPELKKALELSPNTPQLHYDLGVAYKLQDDTADAIPQLVETEKLNPGGYEAPYVLGLLYLQEAKYEQAAQELEKSLKLHPENGDGWATLGSVDNDLNRLPQAVQALNEAIQRLPDQADSHLILAMVLMKQGKRDEAASERKVAAELMRTHMNLQRAEVATNSGKSLLLSGKIDDAIVEFHNAITFDARYAEAHAGLAEALQRLGKLDEAAAERQKAKELEQAKP